MSKHEATSDTQGVTLKKVAVVIPCFNEADGIARVISQFPYHRLAQNNLQLTVYVIDNNSTDNTAAIAQKAGATVLFEPKKGKGNALRKGFTNLPPDVDYVVMLDGDDTYNPDEILRVIEPLINNFCDVVVGSRLGGRIQESAMSTRNRLGNKIFTAGARVLYGANISDVLTGYFAWKKPILDALVPHITSSGFAIEMEMITKMARLGFQMTSVPISYHPRAGTSNLHPYKDGGRIFSMLLRNFRWHSLGAKKVAQTFTPFKIVFVSDAIYPYMKGGKEKRLHELSKRLAAMGHDVHIYTMHWWGSSSVVRQENGVFLHAICKRHRMYNGSRRTIKEGVLFGLACFKLFRVPFDIIDVDHMPFFPIFSTWAVCTLRGRKLYATWHETLSYHEWISYMGTGGVIAALIERISILLPYRITAASQQTKELLGVLHGRSKRVELVASGIDTSLLRSIQAAPMSCDVLYVGRLVKDKNIDKLVLAMQIITQSQPAARCIILGEGPEKKRLQQLVNQHDLQNNVIFLDHLPEPTNVYAIMKAAKVFCSPSVREGFGIVSLEALGCGTPVVTVNSPSNAARHLIYEGKNGSVVSLDPQALATAIERWMSVSKKPKAIASLAEYDWHQVAQKQAEVYTL